MQPAPPATPAELLERAKVAGRWRPRRAAPSCGARRASRRRRPASRSARSRPCTDSRWSRLGRGEGGVRRDARSADDRPGAHARSAAQPRRRASSRSRGPGAPIAFATAAPASLLTVLPRARPPRGVSGAEVADLADVGPIRADGRAARWLRWVDGVAVVTDGRALCATTHDGEARPGVAVRVRRPALVVADGPFAEVAWRPASRSSPSPASTTARSRSPRPATDRCRVVPMRTDRPPAAYRSVVSAFGPPAADQPVGSITARNVTSHTPRELTLDNSCPPAYARLSAGMGRRELAWTNGLSKARFLTVQEVADLMRVSSMTVYRLIKAGELPAVRVGRSFRVAEPDVDTYLASRLHPSRLTHPVNRSVDRRGPAIASSRWLTSSSVRLVPLRLRARPTSSSASATR